MSFILDWHTPSVDLSRYGLMGSDTSPINIYLLSEKYNIEVAEKDGVLFRRYHGMNPNRQGYGFPLSDMRPDMAKALKILKNDARERGEKLRFCLCDEKQKNILDVFCRIKWESFDGDSDYIYNRESISRLAGRKLHKKKNHVNHFFNQYSEVIYSYITERNLPDALKIAEAWFTERKTEENLKEPERRCIAKAAEYWRELKMFGGILYADGDAVAMNMSSALSPNCVDTHFEKAVGRFADDGAYAVINKEFAGSAEIAGFFYINREEDMGISGLKKAKMSYQPAFKLVKYYGVVC